MFVLFSCHLMLSLSVIRRRCTFLSPHTRPPLTTHFFSAALFNFFFSEITNLDKKHAKPLKCDWLAGWFLWSLRGFKCVFVRFQFCCPRGRMISWFLSFRSILSTFFLPCYYIKYVHRFSFGGKIINPGWSWRFFMRCWNGKQDGTWSGTLALINYTFSRHVKERNDENYVEQADEIFF